jgi:two-component system, cell cycle sensor histidine kinase and response regulator CckA
MEICRRHGGPIHLLVSDVVMPGMDGPKTFEALQSLRPGIKVLFLSGYPEETMLRHGIGRDEPAFLKKPFTMDSLARKVRETLTRT